jgi:anti-sigma factor RsiW
MAKQHPSPHKKSEKAKLTCEQVTALIRDYLAGELDPDLASTFEEHLRRCSDCIAFLNTYKQTVQSVQSLSYDEIPAEMQTRVRQFLRAKIKGFPPRR